MKYSIYINQKKAVEWKLTSSEAIVFSWIYELASWADKMEYKEKTYYYGSKNKACEELPIITDKRDTMCRIYKNLKNKKLIDIININDIDYISITKKGNEWGDKIYYNFLKFFNYNRQLKSKEWKNFRKEVFKTKGKKCEICGSTKHLNIHHPFYTKGKLAWEYNPSDMMVLCHKCHKKIHNIK